MIVVSPSVFRGASLFLWGFNLHFRHMIHYNPKSWFSLIFHTYNRQVIGKLLPAMAAMGVFTVGI